MVVVSKKCVHETEKKNVKQQPGQGKMPVMSELVAYFYKKRLFDEHLTKEDVWRPSMLH